MTIETKRKQKEILPSPDVHWMRIEDITHEDVTALLGIFKKTTGKIPFPIGEDDYEDLHKKFLSDTGYAQREIAEGSNLEWRRLVDEQERKFIRFKISGVDRPNPIKPEDSIQTQIDQYFIDQNKAILVGKIFSGSTS